MKKMVRCSIFMLPKHKKHIQKVAKNRNITESQVVRELIDAIWSK